MNLADNEPTPSGEWVAIAILGKTRGNRGEILAIPLAGVPERFEGLAFHHFFLQPMDGPDQARNTELAMQYCRAHPRWRLSLQTHKILGIP